MRLPGPVEQFVRACDGIPLDHLPVAEQREASRLLLDLNFLRFGRPGPAVHDVADHTSACTPHSCASISWAASAQGIATPEARICARGPGPPGACA